MQSPAAYPQPQSMPASLAPAFLARLFSGEAGARRDGAQMPGPARADEEIDLAERVRLTGEW